MNEQEQIRWMAERVNFLSLEEVEMTTHINLCTAETEQKVFDIEWDDTQYKMREIEPGRLVLQRRGVKG